MASACTQEGGRGPPASPPASPPPELRHDGRKRHGPCTNQEIELEGTQPITALLALWTVLFSNPQQASRSRGVRGHRQDSLVTGMIAATCSVSEAHTTVRPLRARTTGPLLGLLSDVLLGDPAGLWKPHKIKLEQGKGIAYLPYLSTNA